MMRTIDVTESEPSLVASLIPCECGSMIPGITNLPVASYTSAPAGAVRFCPIFEILPFSSSTSVFWSVPRVTVMTVAFLISIDRARLGPCATVADAPAVTRSTAAARRTFSPVVCISAPGAGAPDRWSKNRSA